MKLGQMASYLDQGLPEPIREALAQLQAGAPPMSRCSPGDRRGVLGPQHRRVVRRVGATTPCASASIGQVHRAVTLDGRRWR